MINTVFQFDVYNHMSYILHAVYKIYHSLTTTYKIQPLLTILSLPNAATDSYIENGLRWQIRDKYLQMPSSWNITTIAAAICYRQTTYISKLSYFTAEMLGKQHGTRRHVPIRNRHKIPSTTPLFNLVQPEHLRHAILRQLQYRFINQFWFVVQKWFNGSISKIFSLLEYLSEQIQDSGRFHTHVACREDKDSCTNTESYTTLYIFYQSSRMCKHRANHCGKEDKKCKTTILKILMWLHGKFQQ